MPTWTWPSATRSGSSTTRARCAWPAPGSWWTRRSPASSPRASRSARARCARVIPATRRPTSGRTSPVRTWTGWMATCGGRSRPAPTRCSAGRSVPASAACTTSRPCSAVPRPARRSSPTRCSARSSRCRLSPPKPKPSRWPTARPTGWRRRCSPATRRGRSGCRRNWSPARCGSTASSSATWPRRSAAPGCPASAARAAPGASTSTATSRTPSTQDRGGALMGEVLGAGLLAHVPTIMLPYAERLELNEGKEISLVPGLERLRAEVFETLDYDTVVVFDSHWHTTVEFVVSAQGTRAGLFTSDELPRGMCRVPYDWPGDPELVHAIAAQAGPHDTWITAIDDPWLPTHYATVNLWHYLGRGLGERWISVSTAQTGDTEDFLRAGRALGAAIEGTRRTVLLVASGAMSHTFWSLRELRAHEASDTVHIRTAEARAADLERIGWLEAGDHARVIGTMPEFLKVRPEARFAHYLMMVAALGGGTVTAPARPFSDYENSVGTGQVHLWFDRPSGGWSS